VVLVAAAGVPAAGASAVHPANAAVQYFLTGVSATSASNAWAVGWAANSHVSRDVTLHWDGSAWKLVASPDPANSQLNAVATRSTRSPSGP
jgi:hypothetical protein